MRRIETARAPVHAGVTLVFVLFLSAAAAGQQVPPEVAGRYEGTARSRTRGVLPLSADLRVEGGKLTGVLQTPLGPVQITGGSYEGGRLTLRIETYDDDGTITGRLTEGRFAGEFEAFGDGGPVELRRTGDAPPAPDTSLRLAVGLDEWREDLRALAREISTRHKNAFHRVTRAEFERAVSDLDVRLPALDTGQRVVEMARVAAMIGDGHTGLGWRGLFPRVPLSLFWFGRELRVTAAGSEYRRALGARVVRIGGVPVEEVFRRSRPYIPQGESPGYVLSTSADYMTSPVFLRALGLAPDDARASYTFADERGRRFTVELKGVRPGESVRWLDAQDGRVPLYRRRASEPVWYAYLPDSQTLFVNFKGYPRRRDFARVSRELFDFTDKHPVARLVVDVRQNGGGDFTRGREFIVGEIKKRPALNRRGRLYVVTGRRTFSAGMSNAADLRNETEAILVGEPTGARPNNYQEGREFSLPNTRLTGYVSVELYKFSKEDTPGLIPDKLIEPDWRSYRRGRDPVMEWILAQPPAGRGGP